MPGKLALAGRDKILQRGIKIAEANLPSWLTELALSTAYAAKSVETSKSDVGHRHDNATGVADGFMAAADKAKLDAATDQAVGGTVVARNGAGDIDVRNVFATVAPTLTGHLTRKDYVDNKVAAVTYPALGVIPNASLPERLGRYGSTLPGDNWNNARENGVFMSSAGANSPQAGAWFIGEVIAHNDVYVTQTVFNFTNDGSGNTQTWRRGLENGTWGGWYRLQISQDEQDARYQALIAAGTTAQYYRGDKTWQTLDKTAVGLSNVDNTSDANKPVSTAQQTALDKLAKGCIFSYKVATNSGSITAPAVVSNIPTFTFKANRKYRIVWDTDWLASTGNVAVAFLIGTCPTTDTAANTTVTQIGVRDAQAPIGNISAPAYVTAYYDPTSDQTVQVKFLALTDGTGGSMIVQGNRAGGASQYRIYDDGAQF